MFDELNAAIDGYFGKWRALIDARQDEKNKEFFDRLKPHAVGWKVADQAEYDRLFNEWRGACDQIHVAWMNDRWLATMHLRDQKLHGEIEIIKLMQRRPGSSDTLGLDHVDFMDMEEVNTKAILAEETDLKWTDEVNGLCKWTSIWFDGTEAKLRSGTVVDVAIAELQAVNNKIRGEKYAIAPDVNTVVTAPDVE
jgi:hypothetical protein